MSGQWFRPRPVALWRAQRDNISDVPLGANGAFARDRADVAKVRERAASTGRRLVEAIMAVVCGSGMVAVGRDEVQEEEILAATAAESWCSQELRYRDPPLRERGAARSITLLV